MNKKSRYPVMQRSDFDALRRNTNFSRCDSPAVPSSVACNCTGASTLKVALKYCLYLLLLFFLLGVSQPLLAADDNNRPAPPLQVKVTVGQQQYKLPLEAVNHTATAKTATTTRRKSRTASEDITKLTKQLQETWNVVANWWDKEKISLLLLVIGIFVTMLVSVGVGWLFKVVVMKAFAAKTKTVVDDMLGEAVEPAMRGLVMVVGITISAMPVILNFPEPVFNVIIRVALAAMASMVAWGAFRLIKVFDYILSRLAERTDNNLDDLVVGLIRKTLKISLVTVAILFIGQSILGLNITTLLAGAGVIGLGIAFAAQDTISNFFGSLMIILDRPFKVGDRIVIDGIDGIVEYVGFRSTKMRKLNGHLITIPNRKMADNAIENIDQRPFIKFINNLTLVYDTPEEKVERAVEILHEILDHHEGLNEKLPPRIYFNAFNDWALNIMVIIWYHPGDWFKAQEWNHRTNLEILKRFNAEGIEFAFPTTTTYLAGDPNRQLLVEHKEQAEAKQC